MKTLTLNYQDAIKVRSKSKKAYKPISEELKESYVEKYYETSIEKDYSEVKNSSNVSTISYKDLSDTVIEGFPIGSERNKSGELQFSFAKHIPNTHIINIGTTGSGKTTGYVEPGIRAVSMKKNKPNLFITDPKGELFERNALHFKNQGYKIYLLNFKDIAYSDCWNPLSEIYDTYMKQKGLKEQLKHIEDKEKLYEYDLQDKIYAFGNDFWVYGRKAFATKSAATFIYEGELADILSETADLVHQLVHTLIPDAMIAKNDPSWMLGAREILSGIVYAMLEDAMDSRSGFTRENMNLMTVQEYFDSIRREAIGNATPLLRTSKLSHKTEQSTSIKQLRSYLENAANTSRSYAGCFRNAMQPFFNSKIFTVCNGDTVKLDSDPEKPFVVFLITRDFEKSDFTIAGMFIDYVYRKMLEKAEKEQGKLQRETIFVLEEFANIPAIKDFENKIATSRSRNIWFHMYLQSYAQLEMVYGAAVAQTIMDNCNTHIFMGSQNYETKQRFARECGKHTVPSIESILNPNSKRVIEIPLLSIKKLDAITPGSMYMKRVGMPLILTKFIRSYQCEEFLDTAKTSPKSMGIKSTPFNSAKYRYAFLESNNNMDEFARKQNLINGHTNYDFEILRRVI